MANNTYFEQDMSPSLVSTARKNFLIICCTIGPFGFLLSYLFLYLYFNTDKGFFTATTLQFQFAQDRFGGTSKVTGTWIDLNGQNDYFQKQGIQLRRKLHLKLLEFHTISLHFQVAVCQILPL